MSNLYNPTIFWSHNKSQFLDTKQGKVFDCTFSDLIKMGLFKFDKSGVSMASDSNLYVRDALGWANIYKMKILFPKDIDFKPILIKTEHHKIIVADSILIPVYTNNIFRGFHGEIKYEHSLKSITELDLIDNLMVFNYSYEADKICTLEKIYKIEMLEKANYISDFWISIETKTNFINVNGIQLYV